MGWSSGTPLFKEIIQAAKKYIPEDDQRKQFYAEVYLAFSEQDWDTEEECLEDDSMFEAMYCEHWNQLTLAEKIFIASVAVAKNMSFEDLQYSDYMYGKENSTAYVWEFVEELEEKGKKWFYEQYSQYKMY